MCEYSFFFRCSAGYLFAEENVITLGEGGGACRALRSKTNCERVHDFCGEMLERAVAATGGQGLDGAKGGQTRMYEKSNCGRFMSTWHSVRRSQ